MCNNGHQGNNSPQHTSSTMSASSSESSTSDDEFGFRPETDSDDERAAAMAGPAAVTLEAVQQRQREASRARAEAAAAAAAAEPPPRRLPQWRRPSPRAACAHCGTNCRRCMPCAPGKLVRAAASGATQVEHHFGAQRLAGQRLAFAKLMHRRLAGENPLALPYQVYESVSITAGCEQTQQRVQAGRGFRPGSSLAHADDAVIVTCLVAAIRAEQVGMCRLLLHQAGTQVATPFQLGATTLSCLIATAEEDATLRGRHDTEKKATTLLDVVARGPSATAIPMLADMWECSPPTCPWGAATWRRTLLRVHDRCAAAAGRAALAGLLSQHQAISDALEARFPVAHTPPSEHICGAADGHTQDDTLWTAAGPRAELSWPHLRPSQRAPTTQSMLLELHPTVLEAWAQQPLTRGLCPYETLLPGRTCPMLGTPSLFSTGHYHDCPYRRGSGLYDRYGYGFPFVYIMYLY